MSIVWRKASKRFGARVALDALELEVPSGGVLALVGGSGSGKSTALKLVNRLLDPSDGTVWLDGQDVRGIEPAVLRRRVGYVFQRLGLFPHWTVAENIGATPSLLRWDSARIARRVDELLAMVELDPGSTRGRFAHELSGGQAQRVAVARALAAEPPVLLLDEPFGALDAITRGQLQRRFVAIQRALGVTCVFVTHDLGEALVVADRVAVLSDGALVQVGEGRDLLERPASAYVSSLVEAALSQANSLRSRLCVREDRS
jgi:osmoprotectant transport system ATP-binding protein